MSLSPQWANYFDQPGVTEHPAGSPHASTWLNNQPNEQSIPQALSTRDAPIQLSHLSWQALRSPQELAEEALQRLKSSYETPIIVLTVPAESAMEGRRVLAAVQGPPHYISLAGTLQERRHGLVLKELEPFYVFEDRDGIAAFIERNQLRGVLLEARGALNAAFGEVAVKKLTLIEDDEGFTQLFCLVLFPGDMGEARVALRAFDDRWWVTHSGRVSGKLNFDFELI